MPLSLTKPADLSSILEFNTVAENQLPHVLGLPHIHVKIQNTYIHTYTYTERERVNKYG